MKIVKINIENITPYINNAKKHPQEQIDQIKKSISDFGMNDPIAVWGEKNIIVEGHGRYEALKQLGYKEIECIRLDHLTDEERRAYTLAHNKLTMNTDFDLDILDFELKDIEGIDMSDFGFDLDLEEDISEDDIVEVEIPLAEEKAKSKPGDIYQLGENILMCGDSTKEEDVEKLMGEEKADLLFTDPPYNVNVSNSQGMTMENDNMEEGAFKEFLDKAFMCANDSLKPGGAFYVWHSDSETVPFRESCEKNGLSVRQCLIWVKNAFNFGRQDYKWKHEPCLYGWSEGAAHYFIDEYNHPTIIEDQVDIKKLKKSEMEEMLENLLSDKTPTTIIHEDKPTINDLHPTMKPIKLCARLIKNSSRRKELVLDLFGGSGSTLIACEQLDRKCYMMEYDPIYVDVIIKRWENLTGKKAIKKLA